MVTQPCDCCEGVQTLTPQEIWNRPGLNQLAYRIGDHYAFLQSMLAGLAGGKLKTRQGSDFSIALLDAWATVADVLTFYQERIANEGYLRTATERRSILELARLVGYTLRPGVSATAYLAYTLEKDAEADIPPGSRAQSIPGPGEAAQTFETSDPLYARTAWNAIQPRQTRPLDLSLEGAILLDELFFSGVSTNLKKNDRLLLVFERPAGVQTTPAVLRRVQEATVQADQNRTRVTLQPLPAMNQAIYALVGKVNSELDALIAAGSLSGNDLTIAQMMVSRAVQLLQALRLGASQAWAVQRTNELVDFAHREGAGPLQSVLDDFSSAWDDLQKNPPSPPSPAGQPLTDLGQLLSPLLREASRQPATSARLVRNLGELFTAQSDNRPQLLVSFFPALRTNLYTALSSADVSQANPSLQAVYVLRQAISLFGNNAPPKFVLEPNPTSDPDVKKAQPFVQVPVEPSVTDSSDEASNQVYLDGAYEAVIPGGYVVIQSQNNELLASSVVSTEVRGRSAYGVNSKTTAVVINDNWWDPYGSGGGGDVGSPADFSVIRTTIIYAPSEKLDLAEIPIVEDIGLVLENPGSAKQVVLDGLYDGLKTGRWLIVSGERTDIPGTSGVQGSELVMLAGVQQTAPIPGDKLHTILTFARQGLAYRYKRENVRIFANVVKSTHGETRNEVLGAGDGSQAFQSFVLKQSPLTYLSAPTPFGAASTLKVYVNDVQWQAAMAFSGLGPDDRVYLTKTGDDDKTTAIFGDGQHGRRLPSGQENVRAVYRNGTGQAGNVKAGAISLLASRPLGVKDVVNPLPATGGADRESLSQARRNTPLALLALDRLVSVQDYADFATTFAGIGKASAARLSDRQRQVLHLTIAGAGDIPIDLNSDLYRNLRQALLDYGDAAQALQVSLRELLALVISARVRLLPDYLWDAVELKVRIALLDTFSFERRELGQSVFLSQVISAIQAVPGVAYVDVEVLDTLSESEVADAEKLEAKRKAWEAAGKPRTFIPVSLARQAPAGGQGILPGILPAQLAYLLPAVPDTLVLKEI